MAQSELEIVTFRVDPDTRAVLARLIADIEPAITRGRKSVAIRRALIDADKRLDKTIQK